MESNDSLIKPSNQCNQLSSDDRCYSLIGPVLTGYKPIFSEIYKNIEPMKFSINDIMQECKKNKAIALEESIVDFATICNKIVCSLFHGSQMQYKKDSYTKADDPLDEWANSIRDLLGIITNKTENNSAVFFKDALINKDITVSSAFLKQLDEAIKDTDLKLFDNPNYVKQDINLEKLFKYLGNRILQLARNAFNNMYYKIQSTNFYNSEDKKEYLDKYIFGDVILPFYDNLKTLKNGLYTINQYIVSCKDYDKTLLNKQLKSTADYINDVLYNSEVNKYSEDWRHLNQLPIKNKLNYGYMYRCETEYCDF